APARLLPLQGVQAHELSELEEIRDTSSVLQGLVQLGGFTGDGDILPKFLAEGADFLNRRLEPLFVPCHSAVLPQDPPQLAMKRGHGALAPDGQKLPRSPLGSVPRFLHFRRALAEL